MSLVRALGRYGRARAADRGATCELCGAAIGESHAHVADLGARSLECACPACAILFKEPGAGGGRHRTVPTRVLADPAFRLRDADWATLEIPVRLAFFFFNSAVKRWVALYPGPAGTTEAELPEKAWDSVAGAAPLVSEAAADVEAIVAWTPRGQSASESYLVPITACYELTAKLRLTWQGIDGGDEARAALASFFENLRAQARPLDKVRGVP